MIKYIKGILVFLTFIAFISGVIYAGFWIKKSVSYSLFYESNVEETIKKMVKQECLK